MICFLPEYLCNLSHDFVHAEAFVRVQRVGRALPLLVNDARETAVPAIVNSLLVQSQAGDEPRGLKKEYGADGDGAAHAKRLQARQNLEYSVRVIFSIVKFIENVYMYIIIRYRFH